MSILIQYIMLSCIAGVLPTNEETLSCKYGSLKLVRTPLNVKSRKYQGVFVSLRGHFNSPEPKSRVSCCHSTPSVVRPSVCPSGVRYLASVNFSHFRLLLQNRLMDLMKRGRDEVLMVPYKRCCFSARSAEGRIQGGAKIGHRGSPSSSDRKATATNRMHSNDLEGCGKKCCYFSFHFKVKFLTPF